MLWQQIINSILGTSKDAPVYLLFGCLGGFLGPAIQLSRRQPAATRKEREQRPHLLSVLFAWFIWIVFGGVVALILDFHPALSFFAGLFGSKLYDTLEKNAPRILSIIFARVLDVLTGAARTMQEEADRGDPSSSLYQSQPKPPKQQQEQQQKE